MKRFLHWFTIFYITLQTIPAFVAISSLPGSSDPDLYTGPPDMDDYANLVTLILLTIGYVSVRWRKTEAADSFLSGVLLVGGIAGVMRGSFESGYSISLFVIHSIILLMGLDYFGLVWQQIKAKQAEKNY